MKKNFGALKTVAFVFEIIAYLNVLAGIVFIALAFRHPVQGYNVLLIIAIIIALTVFSYVLDMAVANFIRLQIEKYEVVYDHCEVSKRILEALQSKPSKVASPSQQVEVEAVADGDDDFQAWKKKNPHKSINDYWAGRK